MALFGDQSLQIVIKAKDEASKVFKSFEDKTKKTMKTFGKFAIAGGAAASVVGVASVKMAMDFEKSMSNISTLIDTGEEDMGDMKKAVLDLSKRTPVALGDLSSALYDVRSAGIDASKAIEVLENAAKLGTAGLGTTKESADLLTTAINAFGLQSRDSADVANVLFKTVKAGKTDIGKLSQAFGKMAGNAKAANISFEDAQAATASLTALTGKTSEAQNALAQVFLELTIQGGKLDKGLEKNGSSLKKLNEMIGKKGLVGGMKEMQKELGLSETEFKNLFSSAEGGTSVFQLLTDAYDSNMDSLESMKDGTDLMTEAYEKQKATAQANWNILKNKLGAVMIEIGNAILPHLIELTNKLVNAFDKLADFMRSSVIPAFVSLVANLQSILMPSFYDIYQVLKEIILPILHSLSEKLNTEVFSSIVDLGNVIKDKFISVLGDLYNFIVNNILPALTSIAQYASEELMPSLEKLWSVVSEELLPALMDLYNTIMSELAPALLELLKALQPVISAIGKVFIFVLVELIELFVKIITVVAKVITKLVEFTTFLVEIASPIIEDFTRRINILIDSFKSIVEWGQKASKYIGGVGAGIGGGIQSGMRAIGLPTFNDFISRPGSAPVSFSPDDTIIGVKNPEKLGGNTIINFNNPVVRDDSDIDKMRDMMDDYFRTVMVNNKITA